MPTIKAQQSIRKQKTNSARELIESRITIDAGLGGSGFCFWSETSWHKLTAPLEVFNVYARKGEWWERANLQGDRLREELKRRQVVRAYIECPEFMGSSVRGNAAAVKGDLIKLVFIVGVFGRVLYLEGVPVEYVTVSEWKGQLPKEVVERRIKQRLPGTVSKSHSLDSIGIGLFKKGFL